MNRVATFPIQYTMMQSSQNIQARIATSLEQMNTQKKANDYAGLGLDSTRVLSARSMLARQDAQSTVISHVSSTLEFYNTSLTAMDDGLTKLKKGVLDAIGSDNSDGLQQEIESRFEDFVSALNLETGDQPVFGGSQTGRPPVVPKTLDELMAMDPDDVFVNDQVKNTAQVADDVNMQYGILASDVGKNVMTAFRALAEAGPFGDSLTPEQNDKLTAALSQIEVGLQDVRKYNANNGRNQQQMDTLSDRAESRTIMLKKVIGDAEDADLGQVALDLTNNQTLLSSSYAVFSRISGLSLANYL